MPEQRRSKVAYRAAKNRVVEDVEHVRARLQGEPLAELEPPLQRQIDLRSVEAAQGISSQVSLPIGRGRAEGCCVYDLSAACGRLVRSGKLLTARLKARPFKTNPLA